MKLNFLNNIGFFSRNRIFYKKIFINEYANLTICCIFGFAFVSKWRFAFKIRLVAKLDYLILEAAMNMYEILDLLLKVIQIIITIILHLLRKKKR